MGIGKRTFWLNDRAREYIADIMESGRLSYGKYSRAFEARFAEMHGCKYGILANSGTNALQAAVQAYKELWGWRDGSEVLIPALTFVATANVVLHNNLKPVPVDITALDYCMDPHLIIGEMSAKTVAIMPVHLFGNPCQMGAIADIARIKGLSIVEDSCEAVLASEGDITVGGMGGVACFSFYQAHIVQAGVGGMCITNDWELARKIRSLVNHGLVIPEDIPEDGFSPDILARDFRFESIGHSARITELEAAIGLSQLDDLAANIALRNRVADALNQVLQDGPFNLPWRRSGAVSARMMYPIVVKDGRRDQYRHALRDAGIGTRDLLPLVTQECYNGLWRPGLYPVARWADENGFYVGISPGMTDDDISLVARTLLETAT